MNLVISPTLNEAENVEALAGQVLAQESFQLLVVDDDSSDGTWQLVRKLSEDEPRLHLLRRLENHGFGESYIEGFRWAMDRGYKFVFTMDADLSHPPQYLASLMQALEAGAGVAIGSRYVKGGGIKNWSLRRRLLSRGANVFAKAVTRLPVRDCTAGFMGIETDLLREIALNDLNCNGYGFLIELKHALWRTGTAIVEMPIVFRDREHGLTKFNSGMIMEAVKTCFRLRKKEKK